MPALGFPELLTIATIALLLFGAGRIGKLGSELGSGVRAFKDARTQEARDDRQD
jgi:sec-independent protein translocase protein TatA